MKNWVILDRVKKIQTPCFSFRFEYVEERVEVSILDAEGQVEYKFVTTYDPNNVGLLYWFNELVEYGQKI